VQVECSLLLHDALHAQAPVWGEAPGQRGHTRDTWQPPQPSPSLVQARCAWVCACACACTGVRLCWLFAFAHLRVCIHEWSLV